MIADFLKQLPTIRTERLILRRFRPGDAADIFSYTSLEEVARYMTWEAHRSEADAEAFIQHTLEALAKGEPGAWAIEHLADGRVIGSCGISDCIEGFQSVALGYVLNPAYQGRGYMAEAVRAVVRTCFQDLGVNRVEALCVTENQASAHVAQRCGLRLEGLLRQQVIIHGQFMDQQVWGLCAEDYFDTALE